MQQNLTAIPRLQSRDCANEHSISDLAPDLRACPTHLPINIGADYAQ
jgi:hypothetical protein